MYYGTFELLAIPKNRRAPSSENSPSYGERINECAKWF